MEATLFQDLAPEERREMLDANADAIEHLGYTRSLPSEEVDSLKEQLMSVQIKIDEKEEELKEKSKELKDEIRGLKENRKKVTGSLKTRSEYIEEDCYKMVDEERREVGYYSREGILVYSRPARKDELQKTIFHEIRKNGTED
jgi:DNA-directed RNA polymerase subunit F